MRISDWSSDVCSSDLMAVSYSNSEAAKAMTLHLGRLGYKKIAFACLDSRNNDRSRDRRAGYLEALRSEEHTSELQSLMRISYAVFCLQKKNKKQNDTIHKQIHTTQKLTLKRIK